MEDWVECAQPRRRARPAQGRRLHRLPRSRSPPCRVVVVFNSRRACRPASGTTSRSATASSGSMSTIPFPRERPSGANASDDDTYASIRVAADPVHADHERLVLDRARPQQRRPVVDPTLPASWRSRRSPSAPRRAAARKPPGKPKVVAESGWPRGAPRSNTSNVLAGFVKLGPLRRS